MPSRTSQDKTRPSGTDRFAFTPAETALMVGATESFVRSLAQQRKVAHTRVGRRAIKFSADQVEALRHYLTVAPEDAQVPGLTTARSRARRAS